MAAANTTVSIWKPVIFSAGIALAFLAMCAIVMALTWTALVSSQGNVVFAEPQSASQQDSLTGSTDVQDVESGSGGEGATLDASPADPLAGTERNEIAVWLTRMAIGLSSDSAVSYLAYVYSIAPLGQMSTTPTWPISK